jgi:hypothetical protein
LIQIICGIKRVYKKRLSERFTTYTKRDLLCEIFTLETGANAPVSLPKPFSSNPCYLRGVLSRLEVARAFSFFHLMVAENKCIF